MADLQVDYDTLRDLQEALRDVGERLERVRAESHLTRAQWGGAVVAKSMDDFVDNWEAHRDRVASAVKGLAEDCRGVAETFQAVEQALSRAAAGGSGSAS